MAAPSDYVRIRLRYTDLDTFVEKFAPNVTRGGVFLATRIVKSVGSLVPFEIQLGGGEVVLAGEGKVTWVRQFDQTQPNRPYGMGVQFVSITAATKPVLVRILRLKDATGATQRRVTGQLPTLSALGMAGGAPALGGGTLPLVPLAAMNGRVATWPHRRPPVDTSVDLAAELGVDETAVRRAIDRAWMAAGRSDEDLDELLKRETLPPPTLADAMAELPRLLDPQTSRRRTGSTAAYRALDSQPPPGEVASALVASALAASEPRETTQQDFPPGPPDPGDTTNQDR